MPACSGAGTFFGQELEAENIKQVSFCPKIAKNLHDPEMFDGSRVLHILY